ncbi:ces3 [Bugula neritina]|uniref:Carboxylic ester hydrolase n=1 Tax=Bugula neritina TaxID=10212 RepID=A0A7J7JAA5_BUGNE|nr:ces3 [Bugula neritina]
MARNIVAVCLLVHCTSAADPIVTLCHGGQFRGVSTTFLDSKVDLFLGVRYARPPLGKLRFQKPQAVEVWEGVKNATSLGPMCPHLLPIIADSGISTVSFARSIFVRNEILANVLACLSGNSYKVMGEEDCLFLDITVPRGVQLGAKKPVMVWIHGGGFVLSSGSSYIGAAIATAGDVIVVTINYRLGVLGFLTDNKWGAAGNLIYIKGTGNYGLWDQRAALLWVKQNIAQFGGDPDLVTIFGCSAGAASVSAHTIGQHNGGLFRRAITQFVLQIPQFESLYVVRFELLAGFNGQEGGAIYVKYSMKYPKILTEGVDMELVTRVVTEMCVDRQSVESPTLCTAHIIRLYGLEEAGDDLERARRLVEFFGDEKIVESNVRQLEQHSAGEKPTYAYYFTEKHKTNPLASLWTLPDWLKVSADHGDEVAFVFGGSLIKEAAKTDPLWENILNRDLYAKGFVTKICEKNRDLSSVMMTMWTNFAKSGDPNHPVALPGNTPLWPKFTAENNAFLEINSKHIQVITTPNKKRLDKLGGLFQNKTHN